MELYQQGIKLQDSIVLTRYGGVGRRAKVSSSPQWTGGCVGKGMEQG